MDSEQLLEILTAPEVERQVLKRAIEGGEEALLVAALADPQVQRRALRIAKNSARLAVRLAATKALEGRPPPEPSGRKRSLGTLMRDLNSSDPAVRTLAQQNLEAKARARLAKRPDQRAANEQTPPAELRRLAGHESAVVRRNAWLNPALPARLLHAISKLELKVELTPDAALQLAASGPWLQAQLLRKENLGDKVYRIAIEHGGATLVAECPHTPLEVLFELATNNPSPKVARLVAQNPNADTKVLRALSLVDDARTKALIASHPALSVEQMSNLSHDPDWEVREGLATNPSLTYATAQALGGEAGTLEMALLLAEQQVTPAALLQAWSEWTNPRLQRKVARHPKTPAPALTRLAKSSDAEVRLAVAAHFSTPKEVLGALAQDPDPWVAKAAKGGSLVPLSPRKLVNKALRRAALRQLELSADTLLEAAAEETDSLCLRLIASHPNFPDDKRAELWDKAQIYSRGKQQQVMFDPAKYVQHVAAGLDRYLQEGSATHEGLQGSGDYDRDAILELRTLASRGSTRQKILISEHGHPFVKEALALSKNLPREAARLLGQELHYRGLIEQGRDDSDQAFKAVQELDQEDAQSERVKDSAYTDRLAKSPTLEVRRLLAQNPDTSPFGVATLAKDPRDEVRLAVVRRTSLDADVLTLLAQDASLEVRKWVARRKDLSNEHLLILAKDPSEEVRENVAERSTLPPEILAMLAVDPEPKVRQMVARRTDLQPPIMAILAKDADRSVAEQIWEVVCADAALFTEMHTAFVESPLPQVKERLALHHDCSEMALIRLARDELLQVAEAVLDRLDRGGLSLDVLKALTTSGHVSIRLELVRRYAKATPTDEEGQQVLASLAGDSDLDILKELIRLHDLSAPVLLALVAKAPPREVRQDIYKKVLYDKKSPTEALKKLLDFPEAWPQLAIDERSTPEMLLELYSKAGHPLAKDFLSNPNTPTELLRRIDGDLCGFAWRLAVNAVPWLPVIQQVVQQDRQVLEGVRKHPNVHQEMKLRSDPYALSSQEAQGLIWVLDWLVRSGVAAALRFLG